MSEFRIPQEKFTQSLSEIKTNILNAVQITGLPSTRGLCHYINYSIARKIQNDFGLPIKEYGLGSGNSFSNDTPSIGYVANADLDHGDHKDVHSYLLVFGVEKTPILIDGANDQLDPSNPFLIARLGKSDYPSLSYSLKKLKHPLKELTSTERANYRAMRGFLLKYLNEMAGKNIIQVEESYSVMRQFDEESMSGLDFMFFGVSRDWLTYFSESLGIGIPSLQYLQEAFLKYIQSIGIHYEKYMSKPPQSDQDLAESMKRLKLEGVIK